MTLDAWREIALGEEAAVYAYGVLAAQLEEPEKGRAIDAGIAHSRARGRARSFLAAEGADPPAPAAFRIPFPMDSADAARKLAVLVESRLVEVYCLQTPELQGKERKYAAQSAQECAARAVVWGGGTAAFPGGNTPSAVLTSPSPGAASPTAPTSPPTTGSDGAVVQ